MPLPAQGAVPLVPLEQGAQLNPAYLIKFPEEVWAALQGSSENGLSVTVTHDGGISINIPNQAPIPLDARVTGNPSELHVFHPSPTSPTLSLISLASARLSVPLSSASSARAADRLKAQNDAIDRERRERAERVNGSESKPMKTVETLASSVTSMARGHSNPIPAPAITSTQTQPMIPLKTRVMQLLALGATTVADIVRRVGGDEQNVMRVVNVVGRASTSHPPTYTLQPNQYAKIKLGPGQWKYTYAEQQQVIRLAREAFDEVGLPFDAEERTELDRKEQEATNGYLSGGSGSGSGSSSTSVSATTSLAASTIVAEPSKMPPSRTASPSGAKMKTTTNGNGRNAKAGPQSKIARERAKFMAEKRAVSLPNVKPVDGTASPRLPSTTVQDSPNINTTVKDKEKDIAGVKRKRDKEKEKDKEELAQNSQRKKKRASFDYSSDSSNEGDERGRPRLINGKYKETARIASDLDVEDMKGKDLGTGKTRRSLSPVKTKTIPVTLSAPQRADADAHESSDEEGEIRGRPQTQIKGSPALSTNGKRKAPPPELKLNGHSNTTTNIHPLSAPIPKRKTSSNESNFSAGIERDPEALRDRYEELFPAYQLLTKKLVKIHRTAESNTDTNRYGEKERLELAPEEVEKMVRKWEKWHNELAGIRRCFGEI